MKWLQLHMRPQLRRLEVLCCLVRLRLRPQVELMQVIAEIELPKNVLAQAKECMAGSVDLQAVCSFSVADPMMVRAHRVL